MKCVGVCRGKVRCGGGEGNVEGGVGKMGREFHISHFILRIFILYTSTLTSPKLQHTSPHLPHTSFHTSPSFFHSYPTLSHSFHIPPWPLTNQALNTQNCTIFLLIYFAFDYLFLRLPF